MGALACGAGLGGTIVTIALLLQRGVQFTEAGRYGEAVSDLSLHVVGLGIGIGVAAFFGWRRSRPLDNIWQRGVIGVLSAVGAIIIAFFLGIPAWHLLRFLGLGVLALASAALGVAGSNWAIRGARGETVSAAEREAGREDR